MSGSSTAAPPGSTQYTLAQEYWLEAGSIDIYDVGGLPIATIPIGFMAECAEENWEYVYTVVRYCIEDAGKIVVGTVGDGASIEASSTTPLQPGRYTFVRTDNNALGCTYSRGPESKRKGRAPGAGDDDNSTISNSKRSSNAQSKFRTFLIARDQRCLVTNAAFQDCTASHIVPYSRSELYPVILGRRIANVFEPWMGLLLVDELHKALDRYDWALFPRDDEYVVHYFSHFSKNRKHLHGKRISFDRFKAYPDWKPNKTLLLWHYRQCVQMHFRGFSYGISAQATLEEMMPAST